MNDFDEYEFTQRMYYYELDRKQQLESNISLPTGAIIAAFGVLGYYFTHFKFAGSAYQIAQLVEGLFLLATFASGMLLSMATYWSFQAAVGSTYEYLPGAETLRQYLSDLTKWHATNNTRTAKNLAKQEFESYVVEAMAKCSQINWNTNLVRSEELHRTKRFTVLGLVALAICASCYYIDFWFDPPTIKY